jgi:hypothetical protein
LKVISQFWNGKRIYTDQILLLFHLKGSFTVVRFALCWKFSNKNQWYRRFLNKFRIFRILFCSVPYFIKIRNIGILLYIERPAHHIRWTLNTHCISLDCVSWLKFKFASYQWNDVM